MILAISYVTLSKKIIKKALIDSGIKISCPITLIEWESNDDHINYFLCRVSNGRVFYFIK